jgi:hypothetical protein
MKKYLGFVLAGSLLCAGLSSAAEARRQAPSGKARTGGKHAASAAKHSAASKRSKRGKRRQKPAPPPAMPSRIEVLSIDRKEGVVRVELLGPSRPPESRLFVLTDERGRRFVPAAATCTQKGGAQAADAGAKDKPDAETETAGAEPQSWICSMVIAPIYRRAALTGVSMEWGDRVVSAVPGQVRARWAEAPSGAPPPVIPPEPMPAPDETNHGHGERKQALPGAPSDTSDDSAGPADRDSEDDSESE